MSTDPATANQPAKEEQTSPETAGQTQAPSISESQETPRKPAAPISLPWGILIGIIILLAVSGLGALIFFYRRKKEEEAIQLRRQRRLERLEDIGYSSADFDRLVAQRRGTSAYSPKKRRRRRGRRFFR